jgi:signal transduction histidine kinase
MAERMPVVDELYYAPLGEWVENHMFPSRDGGLVTFQVYVTERHRAEAELRRSEALLAEGQRITHTGSWVWNVASGELVWSAEHFRICGVDPATFTLTFETACQLIHPEDRAATLEAYETALQERSNFEREFRLLRPDGTVRHVKSLAHPVIAKTGELTEFVGTMLDVTEHKKEEAARETLRRRLVEAQEDERRRIALDMHDHFGQQLSALAMKLSALKRDCDRRTGFQAELAQLEAITRQLDTDLELIVSRLRPSALDDFGLTAALAHYVKRWSDGAGVRAEWHASGVSPDRLPDDIEITLYRIAQEALNNVAKHAHANNVTVLLDVRSDRASLIIEDDGAGFDPEHPTGTRQRFGISGMRERATLAGGTLDLESAPGKGTTVAARIPLRAPPQGEL